MDLSRKEGQREEDGKKLEWNSGCDRKQSTGAGWTTQLAMHMLKLFRLACGRHLFLFIYIYFCVCLKVCEAAFEMWQNVLFWGNNFQ